MTHLEGILWKLECKADKPPATTKQKKKLKSLTHNLEMAMKLINVQDLNVDEAGRYIDILHSALTKLQ